MSGAVTGPTLFTKMETFGERRPVALLSLRQHAQGRVHHRHMVCLLGREESLQREAIVGAGLLSREGLP